MASNQIVLQQFSMILAVDKAVDNLPVGCRWRLNENDSHYRLASRWPSVIPKS